MPANKPQLPLNPGWAELMESLRRLPTTGLGGFEGFCAAMLATVYGEKFVVAAGGSQPTADAVAVTGNFCVQSKRYRATTALGVNDIIGNIHGAVGAAPDLEVYVLAVSRDTAQIRQRIIDTEEDTGLDIVILEGDDEVSPLSALIVSHWAAVRHFLSECGPDWDVWAGKQAAEKPVNELVAQATAELRDGLRTQSWLQQAARRRLETRFSLAGPASALATPQAIDLSKAVARVDAITRLSAWWTQPKKANGVVSAEEGFGKSWTTAAFTLAKAGEGVPVLWLDSSLWLGCDSIEKLVRQALETVIPDGNARLPRFTRKLLRLWRKPVLVVLDGVNEHGCFETAQRLLMVYSQHSKEYAARFRILFTSRPLQLRPAWDKAIWSHCQEVAIQPFDDAELTAALQLHAPGVTLADLPPGLVNLARVPRYFHLAVKLRERLRSLGEITKPLLLFADLLAKVESALPSFRQLYPGGNLHNAEEVLAYLAKRTQKQLPTGWQVERDHVDKCFPHLDPRLFELAERKLVIEQGVGRVVISHEHVSLGFALHLLHVGEQSTAGSLGELADEIARELEPNREQDFRTEALHLALLLTCFRAAHAHTARLRAALLALWWNSQNAAHSQARLDFWAREDVEAYLLAVETVFAKVHSAPAEESLILPLAVLWRDQPAITVHMTPTLERWLSLVYPETVADDTPAEAAERQGFPLAANRELLRLSAVALSILSQRPDLAFLPALAKCARTRTFCVTKLVHDGKTHRNHHKDIGGVISTLLLWGYGDGVLAKLERLAGQTAEPGLIEGYRLLAELTDPAELPHIFIRPPSSPPLHIPWPDNSPEACRRGLSDWIAHLPESDAYWARHNHLGRLAAMQELPALTDGEAEALAGGLKALAAARNATNGAGRDYVEGYADLLPWVARSRPDLIREVHAECWQQYFISENPQPIAWEPMVPLEPVAADKLIATIRAGRANEEKAGRADAFSTHLTTTLLVSAKEETWLRWFEHLLAHPGDRHDAWEFFPAPLILARVATPAFRNLLLPKYHAAVAADGPRSRAAAYWLYVLAWSHEAAPAMGLAKWAYAELGALAGEDPRIGSFLRLVADSGDAGLIEAVLRDEQVKRHLAAPRHAQTFGNYLRQPDRPIQLSVRDVAGKMPLNLARGFLLMASTEADLVDYARAVAQAALGRAQRSTDVSPFGFISEFSVDEDGDIEGWALRMHSGAHSHCQHAGGTPLWGVDQSSLGDFAKRMAKGEDPTDDLAVLNTEIRRQNERHEQLPDAFVVAFKGSRALEAWARVAPLEYRGFVEVFSMEIRRKPRQLFDLGSFFYALLRPLTRLDLPVAWRLHDEFFTRNVVRVVSFGGIPAFIADLWRSSLDDVPEIAEYRTRTLIESRNDVHLQWIALSAHAGSTLPELESNIERLLTGPSKDRAFAITLAAFTDNATWWTRLAAFEAKDPSRWVRRQAGWARRVLKEALDARRLWDEIARLDVTSQKGFEQLAADLVRLRTVLPLSSRWWPRAAWEATNQTASALLLAHTWNHWNSSRNQGVAGDRQLTSYFCGYDLSRDYATRMAPWWPS